MPYFKISLITIGGLDSVRHVHWVRWGMKGGWMY